jgi:hypothetical protein
MTPEQLEQTQVQYGEYKRWVDKTETYRTAVQSTPDPAARIRKAEANNEILDEARLKNYREWMEDYEGLGSNRVEVKNSIVTDTGRVIIDPAAAEAWGLGKDMDATVYKDQFDEFAKILKEKGGVSDESLAKLQMTIQKIGSIPVQRGTYRNLNPIVKEALGSTDAMALQRQMRKLQGEQKGHEGAHRLMEFIKKNNEKMYKDVVDTIINFDKSKFAELETEIRNVHPEYQKYSQAEIAEEIMAEQKFRDRLNPTVVSQVNEKINPARKDYLAAIRKTAEDVRSAQRAGELTKGLVERDPSTKESAELVSRRV